MTLPYENATSGKTAVDEMQKILRTFGASSFGVMEDFDRGEVIVQFQWRARQVSIKASSRSVITPTVYGTRASKVDYERKAVKIGQIAVYSILRDWIKGQVTAVEVGMLSFEGAFLGQILLSNGQTVLEAVERAEMLPALPKPNTP